MQSRRLTLALLVAVLAAPVVAASDWDATYTFELAEDDDPSYQGPEGAAVLTVERPGEAYAWELNVSSTYAVAKVRIQETFGVDRGQQIVPLLDGKHFEPLEGRDPAHVDQPARVYNLTGSQGTWTYRLGLPGPGPVNLSLERDVAPPSFEVDQPTNVTHFSFDLVTRTPEPAMAELVIDGPDRQRTFPTARPGTPQRFPAQGMDPETTYTYHVRFWDWSGNEATSPEATLTTAPAPNPPKPEVTPISPQPNATLPQGSPVVVEATYSSPDSPVLGDEIRVFFDKGEVPGAAFTVSGGTVTYQVPGPLEERPYFVSIEVPNQAGGTGVARWSFTVGEAQTAPTPWTGVAGLLGSVLAASIVACRSRP